MYMMPASWSLHSSGEVLNKQKVAVRATKEMSQGLGLRLKVGA